MSGSDASADTGQSSPPPVPESINAERVRDYATRNPTETVSMVLGRFLIDPRHYDAVAGIMADARAGSDTDNTGDPE